MRWRLLSCAVKLVRTLLHLCSVVALLVQTSCAVKKHGGFEPLTHIDLAPGPRFYMEYSDGIFPPGYELSSKMDQPMLLEFFFAGCRACRDNREAFHEVASEMAPYAAVFELSIDCEKEKLSGWVEETKPSWPVLSVCERDLVDELEVRRFPTTLVIDRQRQVILRHVGVWSPEAKAKILSTLRREATF